MKIFKINTMSVRARILVLFIGMMSLTVSGFTTTTTSEKPKIEKAITLDVDCTSLSVVTVGLYLQNTFVSATTDIYTAKRLNCIEQNLKETHLITQSFVNDVGKQDIIENDSYAKLHYTNKDFEQSNNYRLARDGLRTSVSNRYDLVLQ